MYQWQMGPDQLCGDKTRTDIENLKELYEKVFGHLKNVCIVTMQFSTLKYCVNCHPQGLGVITLFRYYDCMISFFGLLQNSAIVHG